MKKYKKHNKIVYLLALLLIVSIGYALMSTVLKLNGNVTIKSGTWDIYWDQNSIEVSSKSATQTQPTVSNDKLTISSDINLSKPGDFYEYTIDLVNAGTVDGMVNINSLIPTVIDEDENEIDMPDYIKYSITYYDGVEIEKNHILAKRVNASTPTREKYKIRIEFDRDIDNEDLNEDPEEISIETEVPYQQKDTNGIERNHITKHIITLDPNGGTVDPTTVEVALDAAVGNLPTPTRTNYVFDGWYKEIDGFGKVTNETIPESDTTYYAVWKLRLNNSTISPDSMTLEIDDKKKITIESETPIENYTFTSNNESIATVSESGLVTAVAPGETTITVTGETSHDTATITVIVNKPIYTIYFNTNEGTVEPSSKTVVMDEEIGELPTPIRRNYRFDGWYTYDNEKIEEDYIVTNNITLRARWTALPTWTISFNSNNGSSVSNIKVAKGYAIGELPTSTKNGYELEGWYTDTSYTTKVTEETVPTSDTTYYANWLETYECTKNKNIMSFSSEICEDNVNVTLDSGTKCKRAINLHQEECVSGSGSNCHNLGYTKYGVKGTTTITYGSCGIAGGQMQSGDAFTCDVNGDGIFDEEHERFYYVSDYFDTKNKMFDNNTATLIYYNNVTSGLSCNNDKFSYSSGNKTPEPNIAKQQLPSTSNWTNVSLRNTSRAILAEKGTNHNMTSVYAGTLPSSYSYSSYAARLLTAQEIMDGCGLSVIDADDSKFNNCDYLLENTTFSDITMKVSGYLIETQTDYRNVFYASHYVDGNSRGVDDTFVDEKVAGVRPAIDVPKSAINIGNRTHYIINFNANGGQVDKHSKSIDLGSAIGELPTPTRENYTFSGWYTGITDGTEVTSETVPSTDMTLYAHWIEKPHYTITFNYNGGSSDMGETSRDVYVGDKIGVLPTGTKHNYILDGWYTGLTDGIKIDETYEPTDNEIIYAHWKDNELETTLSVSKCTANENVTIPSGTVCKRAIRLHQEKCEQDDVELYCSGAGYTVNGSKRTKTITYGNCGTQGILNSGDAFTCDVNGDGTFDEVTERFYYVSDYFNTSTLEFENDTAVLIYYGNVSEGSVNDKEYKYGNDISNGPTNAITHLPTTSQWSNVSLKNTTRTIYSENNTHHNYNDSGNKPLPTNFDYSGYAARLLTGQELMKSCNFDNLYLPENATSYLGKYDRYNYLFERTVYAFPTAISNSYWLETAHYDLADTGIELSGTGRGTSISPITYHSYVRPVIEVPVNKISY